MSSPQAVFLSLHEAVARGDYAAVRACLHAVNDSQRALADAQVEAIRQSQAFAAALRARFGAAAEPFAADMTGTVDRERIAAAKVEFDGATAAMTLADEGRPIRFVRNGDTWRLSIDDHLGPQGSAQQVRLLADTAAAIGEVAGQVGEGKFAAPAQAAEELRRRLHAVMMAHTPKPSNP